MKTGFSLTAPIQKVAVLRPNLIWAHIKRSAPFSNLPSQIQKFEKYQECL